MLKILVVDDEDVIRKGLMKIISDADEGHVCSEASNGMEALDDIAGSMPDVVLLDVRMPEMDGRALIKRLEREHPSVRKIVISGFSEFEYVRETMKSGAMDYILKPVDGDQLMALLRKIEEDIQKESSQKLKELSSRMMINEGMQLAREQFLREFVLESRYASTDMEKKLDQYDIGMENGACCILIVSIDNYRYISDAFGSEEAKMQYFIIRNITDETIGARTSYLSLHDQCGFIAVVSLKNRYEGLADQITLEIFDNLTKFVPEIRFTMALGPFVEDFGSLKRSFNSACTMLKNRFFKNGSCIIKSGDKENGFRKLESDELVSGVVDTFYTKLKNAIEIMNSTHIGGALEEFRLKMTEWNINPADVLSMLVNTYTKLQMELPELGKSAHELYGTDFSYGRVLELYDTFDEIIRRSVVFYTEMASKMKQLFSRKEKSAIELIKKYVGEHYNENITLNTIAEISFLNMSYVSDLFKKQTSENFIDYLTNVRINKAKDLLKDSRIKSYEVSGMVGYEDPTYFSKVFKKVVGVSPSEYRNIVKK